MSDETTALIRDLIEAKVDASLIARVSVLAARVSDLDRRRASDSERQRRRRVNGSHVSHVTSRESRVSRDPSDTPPVHILSPEEKKIEPKKVLSMPISPELKISESNLAFAISKGWAETRAQTEFDRFRDHFLASGAKKRDWDATWRNWIRSPYQKTTEPIERPWRPPDV